MKNLFNMLVVVAVTGAVLAGCAGPEEKPAPTRDVAVEDRTPVVDRGEAQVTAVPEDRGFRGDPLDDPSSLLSKRVVYFDFDSSTIKGEARSIIGAHARYLADNPRASITLEGHCDERGTREYNLALGERRSDAVRKLMLAMGVAARQINTVSFGEERPVALGHDESSWRLNRRAELLYSGR